MVFQESAREKCVERSGCGGGREEGGWGECLGKGAAKLWWWIAVGAACLSAPADRVS